MPLSGEPRTIGGQSRAFSAPELSFPLFGKKPKGLPLAPAPISRASIVMDLGTPRVGTEWQINSISLFYEILEYFTKIGIGFKPEELWIYFLAIVYIAGVEQTREASDKIISRKPAEAINTIPGSPSSLVALQNLPQPITVPGGQQIYLELAGIESGNANGEQFIGGACRSGFVTMNYDIIDYHRRPSGLYAPNS